jgi:aminoglycoside/choline kinase family phosphotransferase
MHRDFHSRNLMLTSENNPGVLDFQDAVEGPLTYDAVSLFKDCYVKWPADKVKAWALQYFDRLSPELRGDLAVDDFMQQFDLMGVQRHLKAAGIFARLHHRDGKSGYLNDIPRTLRYLSEAAPQFGELSFLSDLIDNRVAPSMETTE